MSEKFLAEIQELKDERKRLSSDSTSAVALLKRETDIQIDELKRSISYWKQVLGGKEAENEAFVAKIRQLDELLHDAQDRNDMLERQLDRQHQTLTDEFNQQTSKLVAEHERAVYELRGQKTVLTVKYEELRKALDKKGGSANQHAAESERLKSQHEKETTKLQLKIAALKEKVHDRESSIKDLTEKLKMLAKASSKVTNMEAHIEKLEKEADALKAQYVVDAELLQQKLEAKGRFEARTLREKLEVALKTIEARDGEIDLVSARVEELEMSATSQSGAVEEIQRKHKLLVTKLKEENRHTQETYMQKLTLVQAGFADDMGQLEKFYLNEIEAIKVEEAKKTKTAERVG